MKHPWDSQQFRAGARATGRSARTIEAAISIAQSIKRTNSDLPVVFTIYHLAHLCDISAEFLQDVVFRKSDPYRVFRILKRGRANTRPRPARRYRTICVPHPLLMQAQRWIAQNILNAVEPHESSHAFTKGRDLLGAAKKHAGARWLVKMDVRSFFESISESRVYFVFRNLGYPALLSFQLARICTRVDRYDQRRLPTRTEGTLPYRPRSSGHLPQGAPTSPMLANLAVRALDVHLTHTAEVNGWVYTRYADDLAFSRIDDVSRTSAVHLIKLVEMALGTFNLVPQRPKTCIASPRARKLVLGVLVDRERPRLSRPFRDNLETHLYALTSPKLGPAVHMKNRGFASRIGMRRHVGGLLAFAHQIDAAYAAKQYELFNTIDWNR